MNRTHKTLRNSAVSLMGQILTILLSFISRKVYIQYLGVELLGLNATFASVLNTLSLAELGFQQVIVFHLYGVLARGDHEEINNLVNIYKVVYRWIGCFFVAAALCCTPFLQFILSDVEATPMVRVYFLIQALTGACTYFLAYKRNILYADQNSYISGLIDTAVNTAAMVISILVVAFTGNYLLFLLVQLAKTYLSNLLVHIVCTKRYPYLHSTKLDWKLLKTIARDLKNVVIERIAGYIYSSTDNLLISAFISTVQVGFLSNYTMILGNVRNLMNSMTRPLVPAVGSIVADGRHENQQMDTFRLLEQAFFWLTGMAIVPVFVLSESFIRMYLGDKFILSRWILVLMCMDLYIHINHDPCLCFLSANGLFRQRRNISIAGAVVNLVVSALLIRPLGTVGILAGTAFSQMCYWLARSVVTFRTCLKQSWQAFARYWLRQLWLLGVIVAAIAVSTMALQSLSLGNDIPTFLVGGIVCEACFGILTLVCCRGFSSQRQLEKTLAQLLRSRLKQKP